MMKRWLLVFAVLLLLLPTAVLADELTAELDAELTYEQGEQIDRSARYEEYASQVLGLILKDVSRSSYDWLTPVQQDVYLIASERLKDVAAGRTPDSKVLIPLSVLGLEGRRFYAEDLGLPSLKNDDGSYNVTGIVDGMYADIATRSQIVTIMWNLVYDHPREVYWFGNRISYGFCGLKIYTDTTGRQYVTADSQKPGLSMGFIPSMDYCSPGAVATDCMVDTSRTAAADQAAANARKLVDEARGKTDWAKLVYYGTGIRALCEYNHEAAASGSPSVTSGPWELLWVFDGDPETKVVCEGYAKAFKYLVDLSTFTDRSLECYIVTGGMAYPGGGGAHAWNIVVCSSGQYLVDVTNCPDVPTAGGRLFLTLPDGQGGDTAYFDEISYTYGNYEGILPRWLLTFCRHADHDPVQNPGVEAGCLTPGVSASIQCGYCGAPLSKAEEIPALGHDEVTDQAVPATCVEPGLTEGSHCRRCSLVMTEQQPTEALGHDVKIDQQVEPTCTETGLTEGEYCGRCGETLIAQQVIEALGHDPVTDEKTEPTCIDTGLTEGSHCGRCGVILTAQEQIEALGHDPVTDAYAAPSCLTPGLTEGSHCGRCGVILTAQERIEALGHDPVTDEKVDPTCTQTGLTEGSHCGRCLEVLTAQTVVRALGHSEVTDEGASPTCTQTGLTDGVHCDRCHEVLTAQQVIEALGHDPVIDEKTEPTCIDTGLTEGSHCGRCGVILTAQEQIEALGHVDRVMPQRMPTTTTTGLTEGVDCGRCGTVLTPQVTVPCLITNNVLALPGSTQRVDAGAFADTMFLACDIPAGVTAIGSGAFARTQITQLRLRCGEAELADDAFSGLDPAQTFFFAPAGSPVAEWLTNNGYMVITE